MHDASAGDVGLGGVLHQEPKDGALQMDRSVCGHVVDLAASGRRRNSAGKKSSDFSDSPDPDLTLI